jgi:hypothetical protein
METSTQCCKSESSGANPKGVVVMMKMIKMDRNSKAAIEEFMLHLSLALPTTFKLKRADGDQAPLNQSKRETTYSSHELPASHLYNEGAFGGLTINGLFAIEGLGDFLSTENRANIHSSDELKPYQVPELEKMLLRIAQADRKSRTNNDSHSTNSNGT